MKTRHSLAIGALSLLLLTSIAFGQQAYVGRYDIYTGFMYLDSSAINLGETGFHTQVGLNMATWYAMGFDFSTGTGDTTLTPSMLKSPLQQQINAEVGQLKAAGLIPASYALGVPMHSRTETYAVGPQVNYRHFGAITLFIHPDLGAMHEVATPHPDDMLGQAFVTQYAPSGVKTDWVGFYGVGGGFDLNITRHYGMKVHVDFVRDALFSDLLNHRNELRFSVGPTVHFGSNVAEKK